MPITLDQALKAIDHTRGNHSRVARNLGCSRANIAKLKEKWTTFSEALAQERLTFHDVLTESIQERALSSDAMAKLYTNTQMGWSEKSEIDHIGKVEIVITYADSDT